MRVLLVLLTLATAAGSSAKDLTLSAAAVPLDPRDPGRVRVGQLRYRAGFHLTADAEEFGGFSGLIVQPDGRVLAVSDHGRWLEAVLRVNAEGTLVGVKAAARMGPLPDVDGQPVEGKLRRDAEEVLELPGRGYLVSFEREHRLVLHPVGKSGPALAVRPKAFDVPEGIFDAPENKGMEAVVRLADGRLLTFAEQKQEGVFPGWVRGPRGERWAPLTLNAVEAFEPTGAAVLPTGDVLLLERSYFEELGINNARLVRIAVRTIKPGARLEGVELGRIAPPMTVDNLEAVAVGSGPRGETFIYVLSDNNLSEKQRTLLLQFELEGSAPRGRQR